jgi:hypothetical protein
MENLLLENGDRLLLENGNGIFLESYEPPEDFLTPDVVVGDVAVTATLRVNTPKFWTLDLVQSSPVVTVDPEKFHSSDPNKTISSINIQVGEVEVTMGAPFSVVTPRHYRPQRHYVWVYGYDGNRVNVIT